MYLFFHSFIYKYLQNYPHFKITVQLSKLMTKLVEFPFIFIKLLLHVDILHLYYIYIIFTVQCISFYIFTYKYLQNLPSTEFLLQTDLLDSLELLL